MQHHVNWCLVLVLRRHVSVYTTRWLSYHSRAVGLLTTMEQLALSLCRISPRCSFVAGTDPTAANANLRVRDCMIQSD
jgi:hypothetical protein